MVMSITSAAGYNMRPSIVSLLQNHESFRFPIAQHIVLSIRNVNFSPSYFSFFSFNFILNSSVSKTCIYETYT